MHFIKPGNDVSKINKIKDIKNKIINFYDETNGLLKKSNKDRDEWLIGAKYLLEKINLNSNKFDVSMKQELGIFITNLENFIKEYEQFYFIKELENSNNKLLECLHSIEFIKHEINNS